MDCTPRSRQMASAVLTLLFGAALYPTPGLAQEPGGIAFEPELIKVFETDSLYILHASVSPDGNWIVVSAGPDLAQYSLFVLPAEGGELRRLTEGNFQDTHPRWGPDGRFIYFLSNRIGGPTSDISEINRLPFDPATGQALDVLRPVVLEPSGVAFSVSPDGNWLAYFSPSPERGDYGGEVRVVPSSGGAGTALAHTTENVSPVGWAKDGSHVVYVLRNTPYWEETGEFRDEVWSVSREGGNPELLYRMGGMVKGIRNSGGQLLWTTNFPSTWNSADHSITDLAGSVLSSYSLPAGVRSGQTGWFGHDLAVHSDESGMPIFVVPLHGGDPQVVSGFGVEGDPLGWLPDGRLLVESTTGEPEARDRERVYYAFDLDSESLTRMDGLDGVITSSGRISLPQQGTGALIQNDGFLSGGERGSGSLQLINLESGETRTVFESSVGDPGIAPGFRVSGRGGTEARDGDSFYYLISHSDRRDLYRVGPSGEPELVWTFRRPASSLRMLMTEQVAVHGNRIAWVEGEPGDSLSRSGKRLMFADLGTGESKELYRTDATFNSVIGWSNDGGTLAVGYQEEGENMALGLLEVTPSGEVVGDLRVKEVGARTWYNLRWLPDDETVAVLAMGLDSDIDTEILLIDVNGEGPGTPSVLTADDPYSVWVFALSPDGRYIAYGSERPAIATIWRMRLPDFGGR